MTGGASHTPDRRSSSARQLRQSVQQGMSGQEIRRERGAADDVIDQCLQAPASAIQDSAAFLDAAGGI